MSKKANPKLYELKHLQTQVQQVQAKIAATVQRGLASTASEEVTRACTRRVQELNRELAPLTWDSLALQMHLAQELPTATWSPATYYYTAELHQWAKVHLLPNLNFLFEAITRDGQGVLAELPTFQFLAPWKPSTETEYRAMLSHLLDTHGVQWNKPPESTAS